MRWESKNLTFASQNCYFHYVLAKKRKEGYLFSAFLMYLFKMNSSNK